MAFYHPTKSWFALILIFQMLFVFNNADAGDLKPRRSKPDAGDLKPRRSEIDFDKLKPKTSLMSKIENDEESSPCRGLPGRDGRDGRDATLRGPPGKKGERGPPGPKGEAGGSTGGVVYTRWGRKTCPNTSNLVYAGFMAGSFYDHSGGGSNYLCLPKDPIYDKFVDGIQGSSYIYGTEYEMSTQRSIFPKDLFEHDAPCAVCHTESRGSHLMIPARNVCPSGWTLEYKGYLMAGHYNHKGRTQFICVDGNATATPGTQANKNGALLYFVEGQCGSLPCGPYDNNGREFTCVVCTK